MSLDVEAPKKKYSPPSFTKRTRQQATLFLVGHAWTGNAGAWDLLELLFPETNAKLMYGKQDVSSSNLSHSHTPAPGGLPQP